MWQVMFEEYEVESLYTAAPATLADVWRRSNAQEASAREAGLVVDFGHAATHITPIFDGTPLNYAAKRIDVGGKLLTNYLKQLLSARHFNMSDETQLVDDMKTRVCYVSRNFQREMKVAAAAELRAGVTNPLRCKYVLPDYDRNHHGFILTK